MKVWIVIKKDATGLHICKVYLNVLSAELQKRNYESACEYDAKFEVQEFVIF